MSGFGVDPARPEPATPEARAAGRLTALERRVGALESAVPTVMVGAGAPTADPNTLREGTPYIDRTALRKYYVVGVAPAAVWRWVALT